MTSNRQKSGEPRHYYHNGEDSQSIVKSEAENISTLTKPYPLERTGKTGLKNNFKNMNSHIHFPNIYKLFFALNLKNKINAYMLRDIENRNYLE